MGNKSNVQKDYFCSRCGDHFQLECKSTPQGDIQNCSSCSEVIRTMKPKTLACNYCGGTAKIDAAKDTAEDINKDYKCDKCADEVRQNYKIAEMKIGDEKPLRLLIATESYSQIISEKLARMDTRAIDERDPNER